MTTRHPHPPLLHYLSPNSRSDQGYLGHFTTLLLYLLSISLPNTPSHAFLPAPAQASLRSLTPSLLPLSLSLSLSLSVSFVSFPTTKARGDGGGRVAGGLPLPHLAGGDDRPGDPLLRSHLRPRLHPALARLRLISNFLAHRPVAAAAAAAAVATAASHGADDAIILARLAFPSDRPSLAAVLRLAQRGGLAAHRLVADTGAASVLLRHAADPDRPDLQNLALRALLHLSLEGDDARVGLVAEGAIDPVVAALRSGPGCTAAALAATLLTSLAVVEVNKATIGAHPAAIPRLVALLRDGDVRERREAATALYELCKFAENRRRAARAGAVQPLVRFARDGSERAVRVLGLLSKCLEGKEAMRKAVGLVGVMAEVARAGSPRATEHALTALNLLCSDSKDKALQAIEAGVLDLCLVLSGDVNQKTRNNAIQLGLLLEKSRFGGLS
ncbi:U-box domain-containing protein [Musa troglodytarum]|uniref:U-box domain-containing protein n=1 Tax=Musa troglodytarum TaxID=320322 RepID=A0A9E7HLV2_9LILI|nr:U-box domain-containing protein [Musa troglodytarum]